ncbi:MAG: hypothetical protein K8M05_40375, partial [Deltaproteobacteria bacterium]|nr:hypothetical protein [Kofleriaceae bacterium]
MSERAHTHRDTLALVLVMGGMTSWAVFPAIALLRDSAADDRSVLAAALVVGCLLGAWVATSVFRAVATATVVVAGALTAAVVFGVVGYIATRQMIDLGALEASAVLLSAVAAAAGAQLRHVGEPRRGLATAAIVLAAMG